MDFKKWISELSRRNVLRAVVAYLAVAWVIVQIASIIFPVFDAPDYFMQGLIYLLAIGLIFWTGFSWVYDLTPQGIRKTPEVEENPETQQLNTRRLNAVIVAAGIVALLLLLAGSFWAGSRWNEKTPISHSYRVAVIPFETGLPEGDESQIMKSGFTEAIIGELSANNALQVLSLASSRYYTSGIAPSNALFASETERIDYFITGIFDKTGNHLSVEVYLRRKPDGKALWQQIYNADISEVRQLWAKIAQDLLGIIGPEESQVEMVRKQLRAVNPETYDLYLKGKYYLNKSTEEDWRRGLVYLQEAIDRNPADPHAWAGMAEGYITWGHSLMPPEDVFPKALAAAKRAIQLDSSNAEGWAALSQYHTYFGWDWELADYAYKRANDLNPNLAMNHYHRAWYLALFGRMNEAIEAHKRAQDIDPFSSLHTGWLGELYRWVGEYDLALEQAEEANKMFDDAALSKIITGKVYIDQGKVEEGLEVLKAATKINSGWKYLIYGPALLSNGKKEEGRALIREAESLPESPYFSLCLAAMYQADGNTDKTFEWLQKARGHAFYPWFVRLRVYLADSLIVQDPRHDALMRELNLPPSAPLQYDP